MSTITLYSHNSDTGTAVFHSRFDAEVAFSIKTTSAHALEINRVLREMEGLAYQAAVRHMAMRHEEVVREMTTMHLRPDVYG